MTDLVSAVGLIALFVVVALVIRFVHTRKRT